MKKFQIAFNVFYLLLPTALLLLNALVDGKLVKPLSGAYLVTSLLLLTRLIVLFFNKDKLINDNFKMTAVLNMFLSTFSLMYIVGEYILLLLICVVCMVVLIIDSYCSPN